MGDKERMDLAEEVMHEKHGVFFQAEEIKDASDGGFYAWLRPAEMPEVLVRAYVDEESKSAVDNYIPKKMAKEVSDRTEWVLKDIDADIYIRTDQMLEFANGDEGMSPEDYIKEFPGEEFRINIITDASGQKLKELLDKIPEIRNSFGFDNGSIELILVDTGIVDAAQKEIETADSMYDIDVLELLENGRTISIPISSSEPVPAYEEVNGGRK